MCGQPEGVVLWLQANVKAFIADYALERGREGKAEMEVDREQLEVLASERDDWEDIWIGSMPVVSCLA